MTIHPIGDSAAALYLSAADLHERGVPAGELTPEQALSLARAAFAQLGLPLAGSIEIEAFPNQSGVLVFIRLSPSPRHWVAFDSLDALLEALPVLPFDGTGIALYTYDGRYFLSLSRPAEHCLLRLTEFGYANALTPVQEAALTEHAHPVAAGEEFSRFRSCFCV